MSTTANNPTQAVFERVVARHVAAPDLQHGRLVHVMWVAPGQGDRLVQIYVNGRLCEVTRSTSDRQAWLLLDALAHDEIELIAVDPADAAKDLSASMAGESEATQPAVEFALLRDYSQPIDAIVTVELEGGNMIDESRLFSADTPRGGFGAVFGEGRFGYDVCTGLGLGQGELGYGPLGIDSTALRWKSDALSIGAHALELGLRSLTGAQTVTEQNHTVNRLPQPPTNVALSADLQLTGPENNARDLS